MYPRIQLNKFEFQILRASLEKKNGFSSDLSITLKFKKPNWWGVESGFEDNVSEKIRAKLSSESKLSQNICINDTLDRNDEILPYEIEINPCSRINFVSIEKFRI